MNHLVLSCIAVSLLFSSCSSPRSANSIAVDRLHQLGNAARLKAHSVRISTRMEQDGAMTTLPMVTARMGQTAKVALSKEFRYPTAFALPETKPTEKPPTFPVTPTTPTAFRTEELGIVYTITPKIRGPFIELTGLLTHRRHVESARGAGEAFSIIMDPDQRVVLTENKVELPHFRTDEYRVHTVGLPGTGMVIEFDGARIHITAEIVR